MQNHAVWYQWYLKHRKNKMCRAVLWVSLLVFAFQYADSTLIPQNKDTRDLNIYANARGIKDIWDNVKASIQSAWNAIKTIADNTKEKIEKWREDLKKRAEELAKEFEKRVENIKQKMKEALSKLVQTGEQLKKCVKDEDKVIESILKEILKATLKCVSDNMNKLSAIDNHEVYLRNSIENTEYLDQIEKQLKTCALNEENAIECFDAVRKEAFDKTETLERHIFDKRAEARSILDDVLDNIVTCTTQGIVESSSSIADEAEKILECVKQD